jgi:hypothetical protein
MHQQSRSTLSEAIKRAVAESGKSVNAVAKEAGVPQTVVQRFVSGQRGLLLGTAERLCAYLGLELQAANNRPQKIANGPPANIAGGSHTPAVTVPPASDARGPLAQQFWYSVGSSILESRQGAV